MPPRVLRSVLLGDRCGHTIVIRGGGGVCMRPFDKMNINVCPALPPGAVCTGPVLKDSALGDGLLRGSDIILFRGCGVCGVGRAVGQCTGGLTRCSDSLSVAAIGAEGATVPLMSDRGSGRDVLTLLTGVGRNLCSILMRGGRGRLLSVRGFGCLPAIPGACFGSVARLNRLEGGRGHGFLVRVNIVFPGSGARTILDSRDRGSRIFPVFALADTLGTEGSVYGIFTECKCRMSIRLGPVLEGDCSDFLGGRARARARARAALRRNRLGR